MWWRFLCQMAVGMLAVLAQEARWEARMLARLGGGGYVLLELTRVAASPRKSTVGPVRLATVSAHHFLVLCLLLLTRADGGGGSTYDRLCGQTAAVVWSAAALDLHRRVKRVWTRLVLVAVWVCVRVANMALLTSTVATLPDLATHERALWCGVPLLSLVWTLEGIKAFPTRRWKGPVSNHWDMEHEHVV